MKCHEETNNMYDEPLLSFGDDTIAAINQMEISRLIGEISQEKNFNLKNTSSILSQKLSTDLHLSPVPVQKSLTNKNNNSELSVSTDRSASQLYTQQKCDLRMWGLPNPVLQQYEAHGIKTMFSWQVECLSDAEVLEGRNLVYSAPTSAGKTLVAELLTIKAVLEKKKKAVIILPFVSVVREKMFYLKNLLETSGVRVEGLMGGHNVHGGFKNIDIAVCTIEKANGLINRLMEEESLHCIGIVVVDELHLLGDPFRGYLLELLITKIRYMSTVNDEINIQLVGMSATLPNLDLLATWLDACLYKTDFRPIPLNEYLKVGSTVYTKSLEVKRTVDSNCNIQNDSDHVIYLCLETILNGYSCLIFCPTKNWCEKLAISIAKEFFNIGNSTSDIGLKLRDQLKSEAIVEALGQLKACPVGLDNALAKSIAFGVAFHHAGLTIDERDIIEGLFRSGVVRVLVATSTLSSGVNLPARRVLIRTPVFHRKPLDIQAYKQMVGRAGRMGKDTEGESFLLCNKSEQKIGEQLIQDDLKPIASCLGHGELSSSLKRAILEVIASGVAETPEQVECYTKCTLLATSHTGLENPVESCIKFLLENECIRLQLSEDSVTKYVPTPLGNACLSASMSPDDGLELFQELQKARQCFVLENELHLIYLVTPYSVSAQWGNLDWLQIMSLWEKLPPSMRRVGDLVGIEDAFMVRALRGTLNLHSYKQLHKLSIHRRFYTALALQELVNEVPLVEVATKFQCSKGMLQSLQQTSATFAGMVTAFCKRLGWRNLELLVSQFQERLQFGVHRELCELMRLDLLNGPRARALFNAGITSLGDLASADICQVENALHKSVTFQTSKEMEGETAYDAAYRNQLKTIWITGREGLTEREAAALLIKEARTWLQQELGLVDVKWGNDQESSTSSEDHSEFKESSSLTRNEDINCREMRDIVSNSTSKSDPKKQSLVCESEDEEFEINSKSQTSQHNVLPNDQQNYPEKFSICHSTESALKQLNNVSINNEKAELHKTKGREKQTKMNETIEESQSFDCDSGDEMLNTTHNHQSNTMTPAKSPVDDIFDMSDEDTELNVGVILSKNNSLSSVKEQELTEPIKNTTFMTTTGINSPEIVVLSSGDSQKVNDSTYDKCDSLNLHSSAVIHENNSNYETSKACSSRHSLDIFASPVPISCKSPIIFEDSLIINSYLGNLLDDPGVNCRKSSMICNENENESYKCVNNIVNTTVSIHKNRDVENLIKLPNNLVVSIHIDSSSKDEGSDCGKEEELNCKGTESKLLQDKRDVHALPLNRELVKNHVENGNPVKEHRKNVSLTSSGVDNLTESFLKQAFTTICDFDNSSKEDSVLKHLLKCKQVCENVHSPSKSHCANCNTFQNSLQNLKENSNNDSVRIESVIESSHKVRISPAAQVSGSALNDTVHIRPEIDNLEDTRSVRTKLTFVSDSDEDESDLVPSSQSQSDSSAYRSSSCSNMTWRKKKESKKPSPLKRKRNEREAFRSTESDVIDSVTKKMKTQSKASWDSFAVTDVCSEIKQLKKFTEKFKMCSHVAFSIACERLCNESPKPSIGDKILGRKPKKTESIKRLQVNDKYCVVGVAVCLGDKDAYYIALDPTSKGDASQGSPSFSEQLDLVERLMSQEGKYFLSAFDMKEQYKTLYHSCSVNIDKDIYDPKVAEWLLDSEYNEKGLKSLMTKYHPNSLKLIKRVGHIPGVHSLGLHFKSSVRARMRASVEAVVTWHLMNAQLRKLEECKLLKIYKEVEMPTVLCLARMEVYGIGFCRDEVEKLHTLLQKQLLDLEQEAFNLANHSFSLSSPNEVSKVLFKELQLKVSKYTSTHKPSTNKDVLIKLKNDHPLPSVILNWRKIHFIMNKIILPFLKVEISDRLFGCYETHTATGRIVMHEPNLQGIPRNFDISMKEGGYTTVSMRVAFVPKLGKTFISADYSQLELRLLAHLSQDETLINIFKNGGDVFRSVAATWNQIAEEEVTDNLRQRAKQVCYGVIYGIGANALSDQLEVDEEDAALFMETFLKAYPGLKTYRQDVIQNCRKKGFVETLSGRKRFLPSINSDKVQLKAQAERQAVNTTVQGSAADIAKTAMVLVEASLKAAFRNESPRIRRLRENKRQCIETPTAALVLHLHDELLYEVCDKYVNEVIHIIKGGMESAANLTVPLPVKIKCGKSWGMLEEVM